MKILNKKNIYNIYYENNIISFFFKYVMAHLPSNNHICRVVKSRLSLVTFLYFICNQFSLHVFPVTQVEF